jgi:hypothetical protein
MIPAQAPAAAAVLPGGAGGAVAPPAGVAVNLAAGDVAAVVPLGAIHGAGGSSSSQVAQGVASAVHAPVPAVVPAAAATVGAAPMDVEVPAVVAAAPPAVSADTNAVIEAVVSRVVAALSPQVSVSGGQSSATARPAQRLSLPNLVPWDGKIQGRKAEQFLDDLEFYAKPGGADPLEWLPRAIAPGAQRNNWDAVCARVKAAGKTMSWSEARVAFKHMVGMRPWRCATSCVACLRTLLPTAKATPLPTCSLASMKLSAMHVKQNVLWLV